MNRHNMLSGLFITALTLSTAIFADQPSVSAITSQCYGETHKGALKHAVDLPTSGPNFVTYSRLASFAGRTYVHSEVAKVTLRAYQLLEERAPDTVYVYGETGFAEGGKFRPHVTHQNGLSVDFFVPVMDREGKSVALHTSLFNKLGYSLEFDTQGRLDDLVIDYEAMAKHLHALADAAEEMGVGIRVVIFDNDLQKILKQTPSGKTLSQRLIFSTKKPWVRHDEHYHVDFVVPCLSLKQY